MGVCFFPVLRNINTPMLAWAVTIETYQTAHGGWVGWFPQCGVGRPHWAQWPCTRALPCRPSPYGTNGLSETTWAHGNTSNNKHRFCVRALSWLKVGINIFHLVSNTLTGRQPYRHNMPERSSVVTVGDTVGVVLFWQQAVVPDP